ncbi:MAG: OsmC family protein [Planctomycetota bacterium]
MNLPHNYVANSNIQPEGSVSINADGLQEIISEPPAAFGGSGNHWSPEDLLVAAVSDCFVLSFKAIAAASKFTWTDLKCEVDGTLDKVDRAIQFTGFTVKATLTIPADADADRAKRLLEKAEQACFITNSLKASPHLEAEIVQG